MHIFFNVQMTSQECVFDSHLGYPPRFGTLIITSATTSVFCLLKKYQNLVFSGLGTQTLSIAKNLFQNRQKNTIFNKHPVYILLHPDI